MPKVLVFRIVPRDIAASIHYGRSVTLEPTKYHFRSENIAMFQWHCPTTEIITPVETSHFVESAITIFGHVVELQIAVGTHRASSKLILFGRDIPSCDFPLDPLDGHVLFVFFRMQSYRLRRQF